MVGKVLEERFAEPLPERLIGDKAYDSDPLDQALQQKGIEMIAPHRGNRKKKKTRGRQKAPPLQAQMEGRAVLRLGIQLQKMRDHV